MREPAPVDRLRGLHRMGRRRTRRTPGWFVTSGTSPLWIGCGDSATWEVSRSGCFCKALPTLSFLHGAVMQIAPGSCSPWLRHDSSQCPDCSPILVDWRASPGWLSRLRPRPNAALRPSGPAFASPSRCCRRPPLRATATLPSPGHQGGPRPPRRRLSQPFRHPAAAPASAPVPVPARDDNSTAALCGSPPPAPRLTSPRPLVQSQFFSLFSGKNTIFFDLGVRPG